MRTLKSKLQVVAVLAALGVAAVALATNGAGSGTISAMAVGYGFNNLNVATFATSTATYTGCATAAGTGQWRFAIDLNTQAGMAAYATVLAAFQSGQTVHVGGLGQCTLTQGSEDLGYIAVP